MPKEASVSRPTYAEISAENFNNNFQFLKSKTENSFFCPMVKANAYGHNVEIIARLCEKMSAKYLGVATIEEAVKLRKSKFTGDILVFSSDYKNTKGLLEKYQLTAVVSDIRHIEDLSNLPVHLKMNTGMNRMGVAFSEIGSALEKIESKQLKLKGFLSHLIAANDIQGPSISQKQITNFKKALDSHTILSKVKNLHIYNSDGLLLSKSTKDFGARPGIALYGYASHYNENIKPVMRLKTKIIKIINVKKGDFVSYGPTWQAKENTKIGVLAIGYGDGLRRTLSNQVSFLCHEKKIKQVGTICMDYTMVDLNPVKDQVHIYDDVILFGDQQKDLMEQAEKLDTITYELLSGISERVPRILVDKFT